MTGVRVVSIVVVLNRQSSTIAMSRSLRSWRLGAWRCAFACATGPRRSGCTPYAKRSVARTVDIDFMRQHRPPLPPIEMPVDIAALLRRPAVEPMSAVPSIADIITAARVHHGFQSLLVSGLISSAALRSFGPISPSRLSA